MYVEINQSGIDVVLSISNESIAVDYTRKQAALIGKGHLFTDEKLQPYSGVVLVLTSFYLEPVDPRYGEHHVYVTDESSEEYKAGYQGVVDKIGKPDDVEAYRAWYQSLPKIWKDNPFHNHFDLVSSDITDTELKALMDKRLSDFGQAWTEGYASDVQGEAYRQMSLGWDRDDKHNKTKTSYEKCALKALDIAKRVK